MLKKDVPILEFDDTRPAVIEPAKVIKSIKIPEHAVLCFFREAIEKLVLVKTTKLITNLHCEIGQFPVYVVEYERKKCAVVFPGVGAPLVAAMLEELIALGCRKFIACGGAGVLNKEIAVGHIVVPIAAIRDEGTSYHYLAPGRDVTPSQEGIDALKRILIKHQCNYILGKTWTTDAFYRETPEKVKLRQEEGCLTVEMEAAAFFAVAQFRKVLFAQMLYGGDDVSCAAWDAREKIDRKLIRETILGFAIEACLEL